MTSKHKPLCSCLLLLVVTPEYGPIPPGSGMGFDYNQSYEDLELPRTIHTMNAVDYIAKEMVLDRVYL
ncbi:hypothetical protein NXW94_30565 [Bacteroides ovatus]|nr:hypothetical protein [Bacteroides ovatus]